MVFIQNRKYQVHKSILVKHMQKLNPILQIQIFSLKGSSSRWEFSHPFWADLGPPHFSPSYWTRG